MSEPTEAKRSEREPAPSREETLSALFAQMVVQQANLAMMLMGQVAHPETGQTVRDLDAARLFIDQLEMIEVKTKGNLNKHEEALLKQSLMNLRLSFVEAVEAGERKPAETAQPEEAKGEGAPPAGEVQPAAEESHKKFSKKY